jgi:hypothetical protein
MSIAEANVVINTIVADVLMEFAEKLEAAVDIRAEVEQIVVDTITNHKRVIFNGNNYPRNGSRRPTNGVCWICPPRGRPALPDFGRKHRPVRAPAGVYPAGAEQPL